MSKKKAATSDPNQLDMQQLKTKFKSQLHTLRQLFSENSWNDDDLIAVLQEVNGDLDTAIGRISEGHAQQWTTTESKKTKKQAAGTKPSRGQSSRGRGVTRGGGRAGRGARNVNVDRPEEPVKKTSWAEDARSTAATIGSQSSDAPKDAGWGVQKEQQSWSNDEATKPAVVSGGWGDNNAAPAVSSGAWSKTPELKAQSWDKSSVASVVKEDSSWENPAVTAPSSTAGWGQPEANTASAPSWSSKPVQSQLPSKPKQVPGSSRSTWAQIAKPEAPAVIPVPLVEPRTRSISPKRAAPLDSVPVSSKLHHAEALSPPGIQQQSLSVAAKQLINSSTSPTISVKFGSLDLHDEKQRQPVQESQQFQTVPDQYAQYQSQPPQSFGADLHQWGIGGASSSNNVYHHPHGQQHQDMVINNTTQQQQQQYGMSPANLANMYAAYFPYYMQQFPGGVPPAGQQPPQFGQGQQQPQGYGSYKPQQPQEYYANDAGSYGTPPKNSYNQQQQQQSGLGANAGQQQQHYGRQQQQQRRPPQQKGFQNYFGGEQQ